MAAKKKSNVKSKPTKSPSLPWEQAPGEKRFDEHRVFISGKLAELRKDELVKVLKAEGAAIESKVGDRTTIFISTTPGSVDHARAEKMALRVVSEDEFRRRYLLPTPEQAFGMLTDGGKKNGASRLASLLELNRDQYSRSTDQYSTIPLKGRSLKGVKLTNVSLCGIRFIDCDLTGADLTKAEWLSGAAKSDFRKMNAKQSEILEATNCDFRGCQMQGASLSDMKECRFDGSDITKGHMSNDFKKCRFDGARLDNLEMSYAQLMDCSFDGASMQRVTLEDTEVTNCSFANADLRNALLKGDSDPLVFKNCNLRNADLRGAALSHVRFDKCDVTGAQFEGAKLAKVELVKTDGSKAKGLLDPSDASNGSGKRSGTRGAAYQALEAATPTFKNVTVKAMLKKGSKAIECVLYQFDHGANTSRRQAWLGDKDVGSLTIADAIATIATLHPGLKLDEKSLVVKSSKGKRAPSLKPKALETAVRDAWIEALG